MNNFVLNAIALEAELTWLHNVITTRLDLHFNRPSAHKDVLDIAPPALSPEAAYTRLLDSYACTAAERLLLAMSLSPYLRPSLLNKLAAADNTLLDRYTSRFGLLFDPALGAWVPTRETAVFLLGGNDLSRRPLLADLLSHRHRFFTDSLVQLCAVTEENAVQGTKLAVSEAYRQFLFTGISGKPGVGDDFAAKPLETHVEWEHLVLDAHTARQVNDLRDRINNPQSTGHTCLFQGAAGTGKTLAAALLGKTTGREVYRVDLPLLLSGKDTWKKLAKVIDYASRENRVLLLDEADVLFSGEDAHMKQHFNFLWQHLEDFPGLVIFASRMLPTDAAFQQPFHSIVHFDRPDSELRRELWRNNFMGDYYELDEIVGLNRVAARYELTGGAIAAVLRYACIGSILRNSRVIGEQEVEEGIELQESMSA